MFKTVVLPIFMTTLWISSSLDVETRESFSITSLRYVATQYDGWYVGASRIQPGVFSLFVIALLFHNEFPV